MPTTGVKTLDNVGVSERARWISDAHVTDLNLKEELDFDIDEYERRHALLCEQMATRALDAMLVTKHSNIRYLTGFSTYAWNRPILLALPQGYVLCIVEDDLPLALIRSCVDIVWHYGNEDAWIEGAARHTREVLKPAARIGFNGVDGMPPAELLQSLGNHGFEVTDCGQIVELCRLILSPAEQEKLRLAAAQTAQGLRAAVAAAKSELVTDSSIAAALLAGLAEGTDSVTRGEVAVVSGWYSGITHAIRRNAPIEDGNTTFLEFAGSAADYCAPVIRTLCRGEPSSRIQQLDELARTALDVALEHIRAGVPASEVARRGLAALDLDDTSVFFHNNFGYPVGIGQRTSWMDGAPFHIVLNNDDIIRPGMAFHVPASMILVGESCVAHSHTVLVHEDSLEIITRDCGPPALIPH